jgi:maltose alpha-D-glucosyltransferase/alpha-amylase
MIRSFHYAAYTPLVKSETGIVVRATDQDVLEHWAAAWYTWVSASFLHGYFGAVESSLIPPSHSELEVLLDTYLLEKAIYELSYELNNRPDWLRIPLRGLRDLMEQQPA